MKLQRFILPAVLALFLGTIGAVTWSGQRTDRLCTDLLALTDACLGACLDGDIDAAADRLTVLTEGWDSHRLFFAATQVHDDLDQVNEALHIAALQLSCGQTDEFSTEIARLATLLDKIRDMEQLKLENIL